MQKYSLGKLRWYLNAINSLILDSDLNKTIYKEGTTAGQIIFHITQSINYWLRIVILEESFSRDRDSEFTNEPTLDQINSSLEKAIEACNAFESKSSTLKDILAKPTVVQPGNIQVDTVVEALIHITSHTAEHFGELSTVKNED